MTDKELQLELERFEVELLEKVAALTNGKKNWLWGNIGTIISTLVLLATIAVAWGRITTVVDHLQLEDVKLWQEDAKIEQIVRSHHEDTDRHTDKEFKAEVRTQLTDIRNLIIEHMSKR